MNITPSKIYTYSDNEWAPLRYSNSYWIEPAVGQNRLVVACADRQVEILSRLIETTNEPFGILYVLIASRLEHKRGRYQSPETLSRSATLAFLESYREFFEHDGRHHIWILGVEYEATFVYDNHNLIYVYGPIDGCTKILDSMGFQNRAQAIPAPHSHKFNQEFDTDEDRIMNHWKWTWFELVEDVDDP